MKKCPAFLMPAVLAAFTLTAQASPQTVEVFWDFGPATSTSDFTAINTPSVTPSGAPFGVSALGPGPYNTGFAINSSSANGSPGAGGCNAALCVQYANHADALNAYFKWTLTPDPGSDPLTVTFKQIEHSSRSTTSGPTKWRLDVVVANVTTTVADGTYVNNSTWVNGIVYNTNVTFLATTANPLEFRLYANRDITGSTLSDANWRVDNLKLAFTYDDGAIPPPVLSTGTITGTSISVSWQPVALATGGYFFDASTSPNFTAVGADVCTPCALTGTQMGQLAVNGWTYTGHAITSTAASGPALILTNGVTLVSPELDLTGMANAQLSFDTRSYNTARAILVEASTNPLNWNAAVAVGTFLPNTAGSVPMRNAVMSLAPWCGQKIHLRFSAPASSDTNGAGVNNLFANEIIPGFLPGYNNLPVSATGVTLSGLLPETTYYFRARSTDGTDTSAHSATISATTPTIAIAQVTGLDAPLKILGQKTLTHNSATLAWNPANNAAGYEIEVYGTNTVLDIGEPRLIISKIFHGDGNSKAMEIVNIGNQPADLNEYRFIRGLGGSPDAFSSTNNLSSLGLAGSARYLQPGGTFRMVNNNVNTDANLRVGNFVNNGWANFGANVTVWIFPAAGNVPIDIGRVPTAGNIRERVGGISKGTDEFDPSEWTQVAYDGNTIPIPELKTHFVYTPVRLNLTTTGHNATTCVVTGLAKETDYFARVCGIAGGSTGPWSTLVGFTTLPNPKGTVFIVR